MDRARAGGRARSRAGRIVNRDKCPLKLATNLDTDYTRTTMDEQERTQSSHCVRRTQRYGIQSRAWYLDMNKKTGCRSGVRHTHVRALRAHSLHHLARIMREACAFVTMGVRLRRLGREPARIVRTCTRWLR